MRKIIVAEFISLDGVVEAPETWHMGYLSEEMFAVMWGLNERCDTMLLGRNTFASFAGAFGSAPADDPIAAKMNRPTKVVVSSTLTDPGWANSVILTGDPTMIQLGEDQFAQRLQGYLDVAPALHQRVADIDYVDLRFGDRIYVRPTKPQKKGR